MSKLPKKLEPFIDEDKLTRADCLDLLVLSTLAVLHAEEEQITEMRMSYALTIPKFLNDEWVGIDDNDAFLSLLMTPRDFLKLAQFATESALKMEAVNAKS